MADRNPTYTPAITADTINYKPLSLMAVAGLSLAVVFALVVLACGVLALIKGQPFFLPTFFLFLPLGSAVMSGLGLWEVYNSEGTRAGGVLAKWGLWISVVVGIGYFVYQTFTGFAIVQQANRFMLEKDNDSGFFPRLQGSEIDARTAFLFMMTWNERSTIRPDSNQDMDRLDFPGPQMPKGRLALFMESPLVRIIRQATPGTVKVEAGPVKEWTYDNGSYRITRTYKIVTEDGTYEVPFAVTSMEAEVEGEKRKWKAEWAVGKPLAPLERTDLGRKKAGLRKRSFEFLQNKDTGLFNLLKSRNGLELYLAQQRPSDRKELRERAAALRTQPWPMPMYYFVGEQELFTAQLPGYVPLAKFAASLDLSNLKIIDPAYLQKARDTITNAFSYKELPLLPVTFDEDDLAQVEFKNSEVLVYHPFDVLVYLVEPNKGLLTLKVFGRVVVAASAQLDPNSPTSDLEWRVVRVELNRAAPMMQKQ